MPLSDAYGNEISTTSDAARDHYDTGVRSFLGAVYGAVESFEDSIAADPGFALGHAGLARARMMAGDMAGAKAAIAVAEQHLGGASEREKQHVAAMALLLSGKVAECRLLVWRHAIDHPRDAMAVQLCTNVFGLIGFSGKVGREAELLAFTSLLRPHYGDDWWMLSMHALSLCETGQIDASLQMMERSLALNPSNANASHFKAHAQYEAGETEAGLAFLRDWMSGYDRRSVLHGHLSWHAALWSLQTGDIDGMWLGVDSGVGPDSSQGLPINVLTDTAAILYRAELAGVQVPPERWAQLSDYASKFFPETGQSFADMHAALSHAMAGQGDRLAYIADTAKGFAGDLVRPVARAWGAIARQDWAVAVEELAPVLATTERIGGSRAQRDLLELTYLNALMKLGKHEEAQRVLRFRRPVFATTAPVAGFYEA